MFTQNGTIGGLRLKPLYKLRLKPLYKFTRNGTKSEATLHVYKEWDYRRPKTEATLQITSEATLQVYKEWN